MMIKSRKIFYVIASLFILNNVHSGGLQAPIDYPSADVLPKGVRNLRFKGAFFEAQNKYNSSATVVPLGDSLNTVVSWDQLIEGQDGAVEEGFTEGFVSNFLESKSSSIYDEAGKTTGVANVAINAQVPVFAVGVTDKFTMAVAVPIITSKVNVNTAFEASPNLKALMQKVIDEGRISQSNEVAQKLYDPIGKKLQDYGYEPLKNEQQTSLGDIKLVSKYNLSKGARLSYTLQADLVLPTGRTRSLNKSLDVPTGDGQVDVGAAFLTSYKIKQLTFNNSLGHLRQLKTKRAMRVPEKSDSSLTPDIDNSVEIDLGDIYYTQFGADYSFYDGFIVQSAYGLQYKEKDSYSGSSFASQRYRWMEQDTRMNMQTLQLGLGYNTLSLYRKGKFKIPMGVSFNQSWIIKGKNVAKDPLTSFDLYMFF